MFFITMLCVKTTVLKDVGKEDMIPECQKLGMISVRKYFDICFGKQGRLKRAQVRVRTHRKDSYVNTPVAEPYTDYIKCE